MMKKTNFHYSFLLVAFLLFFAFSFASSQTVTFESKTAKRCSDVMLNITVDFSGELSAWEAIFEITGDYTSMSVAFEDAGALDRHIGPIVDGNVVRMAGLKEDAGDICLDATGGVVVGTISLHTADVCSGTINVNATTVTTPVPAATMLVDCDLNGLTTTVVNGVVTITNSAPTITCPGDITVHWGDKVEFDVTYDDPDLPTGCETLTFDVITGPGAIDALGHYVWQTGGDDVCDHPVTVKVTDDCGLLDTCNLNICVQNTPPEITFDPADTIFAVWAITLAGGVDATDPDGGPNALLYTICGFDGPTWYGTGLQMNHLTGDWTWDIGDDPEYLGDFVLCVKVSDGANLCDPCSPENADTAYYNIHVSGFAISIEKVHDVYQGHMTTVSIFLDSTYMPAFFTTDLIGGFDFLIAYDPSALSMPIAEPGALVEDFEYFTYRQGPFGNCGNGCPSGLIRVVALREYNNGVINTYHILTPGELVKLHFLVTNDRNFGCMFIPVSFYWIDCGDNTLSDETGNWLHLGIEVYDFTGHLITDPIEYGYSGPAADCFDTVYSSVDSTFKNAPIGSIIFRNGGVDIICPDSIDDRGDVNLNGIRNEIADAIVYTNYFIYGLSAFVINTEGQIAASEINGDGTPLTVGDLVYLIRIIVGDASPIPKTLPDVSAEFTARGDVISVETDTELGAAVFVFDGHVTPSLAPEASHMELKHAYVDGVTRAIVYGMDRGDALVSGEVLNIEGRGTLISVQAADYRGFDIDAHNAVVPVAYELKQNYPNPFNPVTTIELYIPVASEWTLSICNVAGQQVAQFSGFSNPGIERVEWNAGGEIATGIYFYTLKTKNFVDTKKMLLLK